MNIASTQYTLETKSLEIYISGCNPPHCDGCHNQELWDFFIGNEYNDIYKKRLMKKIKIFSSLIDNIMIMGGEPLFSPELKNLLTDIKGYGNIWLFTRFEIDEIPDDIKELCDYIKTGKYDETKLTDDNIQYGIKLATSNQKIHKIS